MRKPSLSSQAVCWLPTTGNMTLAGRPMYDAPSDQNSYGTVLRRYHEARLWLEHNARTQDQLRERRPVRVRMFGKEFKADLVKDNGDGTYLMRSREYAARVAAGSLFRATAAELVDAVSVAPASSARDLGLAAVAVAVAPEISSSTGRSNMRLTEKMRTAATMAQNFEKMVDAILARQGDLTQRASAALSKMEAINTDAEAGVAEIEQAVAAMTNE